MDNLLDSGANPLNTITFRIRDWLTVKGSVEGLINHRQWFLLRPLAEEQHLLMFEIELSVDTPVSGYGFTPTEDTEQFYSDSSFGLRVR